MMNRYLQLPLLLLAQIGLLLSESSAQAKLWVPGIICSENPEFGGTIHPNGKIFWFNRTPPDRSKIIFLESKLVAGKWSKPKPQNLGASINSREAEFAPVFSANGKMLFFTSERPGMVQEFPEGKRRPGDIYSIPFTRVIKALFK